MYPFYFNVFNLLFNKLMSLFIDTNKSQCQSQMALNAALLQMLLNLQPKAYQLQPTLSNEILAVQPPVTSTILSTTSTM